MHKSAVSIEYFKIANKTIEKLQSEERRKTSSENDFFDTK